MTTTNKALKSKESRCDICQKSATFRGQLGLRCCIKCGVNVHDPCYGIPPDYPHTNWECHACSSIGKKVQVNISKKKECFSYITQTSRPMDCAICPIQSGSHAMHPLYDKPGPTGHQEVLVAHPARHLPRRLAYVHTACAIAISTSRRLQGCIYGCFQDGSYEDENGIIIENNYNDNDDDNDEEDDDEEFEFGNDNTDNDNATTTVHIFPLYPFRSFQQPFTNSKPNIESTATATATATATLTDVIDSTTTTTALEVVKTGGGEVTIEDHKSTISILIPIGTKVRRKFNDGNVYSGKILSYDEIEKYYKIRYEDGDVDELDIQQVKQCINGKIEKLEDRGTMWIQQKKWISDMRNNTKCILCGNSDKKCPPTHIPIQCTAGEDGEHRSFRKHHTKEVNKYGCQQAMHVGCALWGDKTPYKYNRLQMDPGFGGDNSEPMLELFCNLHAQEYVEGYKAEKLAKIAQEQGVEWKPQNVDNDSDSDFNDVDDDYISGSTIASASRPLMMRAAPLSKSKFKAPRGGVKRKSAATSASTRTRTNSIRTKKATNTTGTSLSSSLLGTTTRAATSLTSSRNSRTKEALCQSDSRDFAKALAAVTGRKRKAPPSSLLGRSSSNNNCTSGEPPPTSLPTRNEQQITWSTATENQRDELISKLKKNAVYEIFREFGSKRSGGVPVIQVQKEYWRRELVVIDDDDDDDDDVSINSNGEQHYQQQEENGDIGITRMSIGEFKVLWKTVKKLLRVDETLITAIDGYKKGGNEVKNNIDNKATNIDDDHRDGNVECSTTTNDVTNDGNVDNVDNENTS
ncbi:hypothetical protein FRACYDRAFT_249420 [Fragilariopsis cylindrus CCMP1102]|uniref:Zinc finger PHD-type domain-containing protein n=1 Tax=Fragilariopsis cylindrus CCMP1102 TaxID=635003 RepID=A0A1E7ERQ9_9STRA|nr:hypothetical protein FRACYDRAFT_249420 [Fragilariopsis cylindrus CCMP1102]|eukprot:OEU08529.1 hypothetical protein FRACYDRAFT_249420 [Fragilariopsis cylindrus CCMP1102]